MGNTNFFGKTENEEFFDMKEQVRSLNKLNITLQEENELLKKKLQEAELRIDELEGEVEKWIMSQRNTL